MEVTEIKRHELQENLVTKRRNNKSGIVYKKAEYIVVNKTDMRTSI